MIAVAALISWVKTSFYIVQYLHHNCQISILKWLYWIIKPSLQHTPNTTSTFGPQIQSNPPIIVDPTCNCHKRFQKLITKAKFELSYVSGWKTRSNIIPRSQNQMKTPNPPPPRQCYIVTFCTWSNVSKTEGCLTVGAQLHTKWPIGNTCYSHTNLNVYVWFPISVGQENLTTCFRLSPNLSMMDGPGPLERESLIAPLSASKP